jgi:hypothetical protein
VESLARRSSEIGGSEMIATEIKPVGNLVVGGVKALRSLAADLNCLNCVSPGVISGLAELLSRKN